MTSEQAGCCVLYAVLRIKFTNTNKENFLLRSTADDGAVIAVVAGAPALHPYAARFSKPNSRDGARAGFDSRPPSMRVKQRGVMHFMRAW